MRFNRTTGGYGAARHLSDLSASRSMDCDLWVLSRWVFCVVFWPRTFLALSIRFWVKRHQVHFRTIPCGRQTVQRAATARSGTECLFRAARKTREPCKRGPVNPRTGDFVPPAACILAFRVWSAGCALGSIAMFQLGPLERSVQSAEQNRVSASPKSWRRGSWEAWRPRTSI